MLVVTFIIGITRSIFYISVLLIVRSLSLHHFLMVCISLDCVHI